MRATLSRPRHTPKHIPLILAATASACLILSGVSGLASLLGGLVWVIAGAFAATFFIALSALLLICWAIAKRDVDLDAPGAME